ncbi:carbon-nitrogen hydrolase family protein [Xanthobacter oligotrophicus]|uniref:carbon-nitrogen hydrolase family protein n=1 Tax=Xanthobacter oligotrophicus TaxID=2607286 RepID=UPI0011F17E45|nr:carbon-nitrogen hydrolase family protein [Xanthobacter oligotrophicus]MCG5236337.1 carbon-nitrogen hydrolase family protein [Xanthobacter oligotrophicus]
MKVKAGVAQVGAVPFDVEASVAKAESWIAKAGAEGCEIVVFPEAFLSVYPKGSDFDISIGVRTARGRDDFRRYFDAAITVPGPETDRIGKAAGEAKTYVVIGVMERELGTMYCTVLYFGPDGSLLGKHRKLMPTAGERLAWGFGDGSTLPVFDTPIGKIGAVICWENYMPMLRMTMYAKGVSLYCAPTADDRETWLPTMRHIALEGRCFVLTTCQVVKRGDFPDDYRCSITGDPEAIVMHGGAAIIDPLGKVLAGPVFDTETLLTAELDLDDLGRAKFDFDVAGNYARPDVFSLTVNEAPQQAVRLKA